VEVKVTKVTGLNSAEAKVSESAKDAQVHVSDMFQLDRWIVPDEDALRVFLPRRTPGLAEIQAIAHALEPLRQAPGVKWIDDPTVTSPDYILSWTGAEWELSPPRGSTVIKLGAHPAAAAVLKSMQNQGSFCLELPPPKEMMGAIALGAGSVNDAVKITAPGDPTNYTLVGRVSAKGELEYAWALSGMTDAELARQAAEARQRKLPPPKNAMPLRSSWVGIQASADSMKEAGANLTDYALRLARIRGWIQLQPPSTSAEFPYRLALQNAATNEIKPEGEYLNGEKYRLVLHADRNVLDAMAGGVPKRWVYVFVIDSHGTGQLIYPPQGQGNVGNQLPVLAPGQTKPPELIPVSRAGEEITISPPFGVDTFYMLATEEPIPDPNVLSFEGVRTGSRGSVGGTPLSRLLASVGGGSRGVTVQNGPVPVNWGIERHLFVSKEK